MKTPLIAALLLCGCHPGDDASARAHAAVAERLRDPESARFADLVTTADHVCGVVNARNGFGGYGGARRFIVAVLHDGEAVVLEPEPGDGTMDNVWARDCRLP